MRARNLLRCGGLAVSAVLALVFFAGFVRPGRAAEAADLVHQHLYAGTLIAGDAALTDWLAKNPNDENARLGLGLVRFSHAVEHLAQSLYRYGLRAPKQSGVPILRLPVPENPHPDALTYEGFRDVLRNFVTDLRATDATLADIKDGPIELPIDISQIRIDIVGDGNKRDDRLWTLISGAGSLPTTNQKGDFVVVLDHADVAWLRGYSHLILAFTEAWLAYDFEEMFNETFGLFFPRAGLAETFSHEDDRQRNGYTGFDIDIADAISMIHLIHWPLAEPERLSHARHHLLQTIESSRASWAAILARTDMTKRRWLPGPGQLGIFQGMDVTKERVDAWMQVLDDAQAVLEGRKLVPHWRFTKGINLKHVFTEPRPFDLVLWFTGPAARPYLESGEIISNESWNQIDRAFGGNFLTYAFWFN
jgi:hypothetical protein